MNFLNKTLAVDTNSLAFSVELLIFRIVAGLMIFSFTGCINWMAASHIWQGGSPWPLLGDVEAMHFPAPVASAWTATMVQFICSLFIAAGLFTRINAVVLTCALGGAILQNLLAVRDPQLAILYTSPSLCHWHLRAAGGFLLTLNSSRKADSHELLF